MWRAHHVPRHQIPGLTRAPLVISRRVVGGWIPEHVLHPSLISHGRLILDRRIPHQHAGVRDALEVANADVVSERIRERDLREHHVAFAGTLGVVQWVHELVSAGHCRGCHADLVDDGVTVGSNLDRSSCTQPYAFHILVVTAGRPIWGEIDQGCAQILAVIHHGVEILAAWREGW